MALPAQLLNFGRPAAADLTIRQGDLFSESVALSYGDPAVAIDLTTLTPTALVKDTFTGTTLATITCAIPTPANGIVTLSIAAATTAALTVPAGTSTTQREVLIGFWDLNLSDGSTGIATPVGGSVYLWREITKP